MPILLKMSNVDLTSDHIQSKLQIRDSLCFREMGQIRESLVENLLFGSYCGFSDLKM